MAIEKTSEGWRASTWSLRSRTLAKSRAIVSRNCFSCACNCARFAILEVSTGFSASCGSAGGGGSPGGLRRGGGMGGADLGSGKEVDEPGGFLVKQRRVSGRITYDARVAG